MLSPSLHTALVAKIRDIPWGLLVFLGLIAGVGFLALLSAGEGRLTPWALQHGIRFCVFLAIMVAFGLVDIRWWFRLAYPFYGVCLLLLLLVDVMGHIGMGAQRWLDLGVIRLQPSELTKIAVVLALARTFHFATAHDVHNPFFLVGAALIIVAPVALVMVQPDLGTGLKIVFIGTVIFFLAGVPLWIFGAAAAACAAALPIIWTLLHDYQRRRVLTFLDPESDPLGSGFHITQSKITLGSGGLFGKGYMEGTQSRLNFLPEKETDFVFTLWAEEWGLIGSILLMGLYGVVFAYGFMMARACRHAFGRFVCLGISLNLFFYVAINMGMVMGLMPVVGVPLPLVSHGGTAMMSVLMGFGMALSAYLHRDTKLVGR